MTDELWEVKSLSNVTKNGKILADTFESFEDLNYFTNLEELRLYRIASDIPFETMPEITSLHSLTLSECSLTDDTFSDLSCFTIIRELDLSDNKLEELKEITSLKKS